MGRGAAVMIIVEKMSGEMGGCVQFHHFRQSAFCLLKYPCRIWGMGREKA